MFSRYLFHLLLLGVAMVLIIPAPSYCDDDAANRPRLYTWTDETGQVNITDDIGKVPPKYRGSLRIREQTPAGGDGTPPAPVGAFPPPDDEAERAAWRARITEWKERLAAAQARYQGLEQERANLLVGWGSPAMAPIGVRERIVTIDQQLPEVRKEIDEARRMLDVVIPEEARKAGVPPGWLRD